MWRSLPSTRRVRPCKGPRHPVTRKALCQVVCDDNYGRLSIQEMEGHSYTLGHVYRTFPAAFGLREYMLHSTRGKCGYQGCWTYSQGSFPINVKNTQKVPNRLLRICIRIASTPPVPISWAPMKGVLGNGVCRPAVLLGQKQLKRSKAPHLLGWFELMDQQEDAPHGSGGHHSHATIQQQKREMHRYRPLTFCLLSEGSQSPACGHDEA